MTHKEIFASHADLIIILRVQLHANEVSEIQRMLSGLSQDESDMLNPFTTTTTQTVIKASWKEKEEKESERGAGKLSGWSAGLAVERSRVRIPEGAEGECSSPGSAFCADPYFGMRSTPVLPK